MVVSTMLASVAFWLLKEIKRKAMEELEWFSFHYDYGKSMLLSMEPPLERLRASGSAIREREFPKIRASYLKELVNRSMAM